MKRPKSKVFKRHKDLIKFAVNNIAPKREAREYQIACWQRVEKDKDEAWVQENRLELEINARANNEKG